LVFLNYPFKLYFPGAAKTKSFGLGKNSNDLLALDLKQAAYLFYLFLDLNGL